MSTIDRALEGAPIAPVYLPPSQGANFSLFALRRVVVIVALASLACSPSGPAPSGRRKSGASPPLAPTTREVSKRRFSEGRLQRLADLGAIIGEGLDKGQGVYASMSFKDCVIDASITRDIAQLLEAAAATESPSSLDELGGPGTPIFLSFERCRLDRAELASMNGAKRLAALYFVQTPLDDAALDGLLLLPNLRYLTVDDSDVGDAGLALLGTAQHLQGVSARRTRVGDATLKRVEAASSLKLLERTRTRVTDNGLQSISQFLRLARLDVSDCDITDVGVAHLARLADLTSLNLSGTRITDAGIQQLHSLNLEALGLRNTEVSNACLKYLANMKHLSYVSVGGTRITRSTAARVLPHVSIDE